jgi:class 3 adenylate cyclase
MSLNETYLDEKLAQLEAVRQWSPRLISKLETMIRTAGDYDLFRVNPYQFASEKGIGADEAIDLFLHASRAGLFKMEWHIICPICAHVVESLRTLDKLHSHFVCGFCSLEDDVSLDDYIQVSFTILPQVRQIAYHQPETLPIEDYNLRYHFAKGVLPYEGGYTHEEVGALITKWMTDILPGEKAEIELDVPPGTLQVRDLYHGASAVYFVDEAERHDLQPIPLNLVNGQFQGETPPLAPQTVEYPPRPLIFPYPHAAFVNSGKIKVEVANGMEARSPLWIVHYPPGFIASFARFEPSLSGKKLLTTQTFRDLFRSEHLSTSEGITVQDITFLFTDLKGSTALYDAVGDLRAYYLVRQHFDTLTQVVVRHSGAIVKTIGDAVMATFMTPLDAVQAAAEMLHELDSFNQTIAEDLILKIGIHRGHSIAVSLNDRMDYFGQTVNIAARVQALADASEIYISEDVYSYPGVAGSLGNYEISPDEVMVKGVREKLRVYRIARKN